MYKPDRYVYNEKASKNRPRGINRVHLNHKSVTIVANPQAGSSCDVFLLDRYLSKRPKNAVEKDIFYCKPLAVAPSSQDSPWYYAVPVGKNVLGTMVKDMCAEAGLEGKKSNHSLCVAGATSLYEAGVPKKLIQQRTGHQCLQSLRQYERISTNQEAAVSRILSGEVATYAPNKVEDNLPLACKQEPEATPAAGPGASVQYNNCTLNVYGPGSTPLFQPPEVPRPSGYFPAFSPPSYPPGAFSPLMYPPPAFYNPSMPYYSCPSTVCPPVDKEEDTEAIMQHQ